MFDNLFKSINDRLDPNNVHELFTEVKDADTQCIENLQKTINQYTIDIDRYNNEKRIEQGHISQIRKRYGSVTKNSPADLALKKEALPHLKAIERLDKSIKESTDKKNNFTTLSENMKKQKRIKEEALLYRETNIRLTVNQTEIDPTELKNDVTSARRLNQGVEKNANILCAPISTENYNDHDDELLAQLDNFEDLNVEDYAQETYYPTNHSIIIHSSATFSQARRNNNNNSTTVVNNV